MAATAAASRSCSLLLSRRHGASLSSSSSAASRAGASRLRAPRCVLGTAEQLRVVEAGKRIGGADPWAAAWTPKSPAQEARLAALPQEARDSRLKIFSGTANRPLAQEIASYLGVDLGKILIKRFADGEIYVQLQESVRGCDVFHEQRFPISTMIFLHLGGIEKAQDSCVIGVGINF